MTCFILALQPVQPRAVVATRHVTQRAFIKGKSFSSEFGKRRTIVIPDKTTIVLNSNTTVWLDRDFGKRNRDVSISGDALFNVRNNVVPFVIHTPHLILTTLRVVAKVNAYADVAGEETLVLSGKLKAVKSYYSNLDHDPYFLKEGDMVMMNKDIDLMEKETFDKQELKTWVEDKFILDGASLNESINKLKNWFNIEVEVQGKAPAGLRYSGVFANSSLQVILSTLGKAWKFKYLAHGNVVRLSF